MKEKRIAPPRFIYALHDGEDEEVTFVCSSKKTVRKWQGEYEILCKYELVKTKK